ncbi:hypothetical protein Tco_1112427 [Tanacetum coccineum]|uniref:Uncharacterized protein n=1 Tax=Tanacetum coccineum TaxID=301880 RepID=A0ABQ5IPM4_9ASTR
MPPAPRKRLHIVHYKTTNILDRREFHPLLGPASAWDRGQGIELWNLSAHLDCLKKRGRQRQWVEIRDVGSTLWSGTGRLGYKALHAELHERDKQQVTVLLLCQTADKYSLNGAQNGKGGWGQNLTGWGNVPKGDGCLSVGTPTVDTKTFKREKERFSKTEEIQMEEIRNVTRKVFIFKAVGNAKRRGENAPGTGA